jgi:hypothetical protein
MTIEKNNDEANDQDIADDFSDIDAELRELGIELDDSGNLPSASGADEDHRKKERHAFAVLKRQAKDARKAAAAREAELEALKKNATTTSVTPQSPASGGGSQATILMRQLKATAMQELGLIQISTPEEAELVNAHANVVYQRAIQQRDAVTRAESQSDAFVSQELAQYGLEDEDRVEVLKRIKSLSPLDRMDSSRVKSTVAGYLGEKLLSGSTVLPGSHSDGNVARASDPSNARAAGSQVITRGASGVRLGKGRTDNTVKPPTPAEAAEMRRVGISDVKLYREAKQRSAVYRD